MFLLLIYAWQGAFLRKRNFVCTLADLILFEHYYSLPLKHANVIINMFRLFTFAQQPINRMEMLPAILIK